MQKFAQKISLCFVLLVSIFSFSLANAQTNQINPLNDYVAYNKALDEGNFTKAEDYAFKAWNNAEKLWGDKNKNTAAFAFNAAMISMLNYKYKEALAPALRARELAELGKEYYSFQEIDFLAKYAEFKNKDKKITKSDIEDLENPTLLIANNWDNAIIIDALTDMATEYLELNYNKKTLEILDKANLLNSKVELNSKVLDFKILLLYMNYNLQIKEYGKAVNYSNKARLIYGSSKNYSDKMYANLLAWNLASQALALSDGLVGKDVCKGYQCERAFDVYTTEELEKLRYHNGLDCKATTFLERDTAIGKDIEYPFQYLANYGRGTYGGAVIALLNIDENGDVKDIRILAEVPKVTFSEEVKRAVKTWKYKNAKDWNAECRENFLLRVSFVIPNY